MNGTSGSPQTNMLNQYLIALEPLNNESYCWG